MCGICGFTIASGLNATSGQPTVIGNNGKQFDADAVIRTMCRSLRHRGPDDEGYYSGRGAHLAMRRLSIIDLSTGKQPIANEDGSLHLVFNGEIYNYRELRQRLIQRGHHFTTQSDSEVILHAFEEYGEACLEHLNGMFALAIWNRIDQSLFLARDRIGIKPLYYWSQNNTIVFGSELKALLAHPTVPREVNLSALDHFLTLEYIPAPYAILKDVYKLPPGHFLRFHDGAYDVVRYWEPTYTPHTVSGRVSDHVSDRELVEELQHLIDDAVQLRMISDVPLGAFLSGGIDSSTIVASMSAASTDPIQTFSIGFKDATYNELPYAREMAQRVGSIHQEKQLNPDVTTDLVEHLMDFIDEPFADFSVFPTYLVSAMAAESVKVVLSGDGGDELFGGYDTYVAQSIYERYFQRLPRFVQQSILPSLLAQIPPQPAKKGLINKAKRFVEGACLPDDLEHTRWMMFMSPRERLDLYQSEACAKLNGHSPEKTMRGLFQQAPYPDSLARQQYVDVKSYLVENILTKVDRTSMAASLEARVPLLDHRIVEFALNLPPHLRMHKGKTKVLLRQAATGRIAPSILSKPKEGFSIPMKHWLGGSLRPLMQEMLSPSRLQQGGFFDSTVVQTWINQHLEGRVNHSHRLWALISFELWRTRWLNS